MTHYTNTNNPIDFPKKKEILMLERFAAQSLVEYDGELIFSKEKFAELIVGKMLQTCEDHPAWTGRMIGEEIKQHFGIE